MGNDVESTNDLLTDFTTIVDYQERIDTSEITPPLFGKILLSCVCAFGIAGNSLIIAQFTRCKSLRKPSNLCIINLAVADTGFIFSLVIVVNNMVAHGGIQGYGSWGCFYDAFFTVATATTSLVSMGLIAITRYIVIVHPQKTKYLSWPVCALLCLACWVYAVLLVVPALLGWGRLTWVQSNYHCVYDWSFNIAYNTLIFIFAFGLISLIISFCYHQIHKVYRNSQRQVATEQQGGCTIRKNELRLAIQLLVVFLIYNICWCPYFVVSLFIDRQGKFPEWLYSIIFILVYWNSAVNVLVYLYYNTIFRRECLKMIGI